MAQKDRKSAYEEELTDARLMVDGVSDGGFSLEEILAEYGRGTKGILTEPKEEAPAPPLPEMPRPVPEKKPAKREESVPAPEEKPAPKREEPAPKQDAPARKNAEKPAKKPKAKPAAKEEPVNAARPLRFAKDKPVQPITVSDVVSRTVDEVLEEELLPPPRRGLFSRRKFVETEELYERAGVTKPVETQEDDGEVIGPEEPLSEVEAVYRRRLQSQRIRLPFALILTLAAVALLVVEERKLAVIPYWSDMAEVRIGVMAGVLTVVSLLCWDVFARAAKLLRRRRFTCDLLVCAAAVVTLLDCAGWAFLPERRAVLPYSVPVCVAMTAALWGDLRRSRAMCDTCHTAAITGEPPYLVADTPAGACKQLGKLEGFYTDLMKDEAPVLWQTAFVPLIFVGALVFAGLASLGKGLDHDFLLCWSAVLSASCSVALPLVWTLPWSGLTRQLQKAGGAVAGWAGAESITRKNAMVLGDGDLFPPGTVKINGIKLYGEEMRRAVSYAASLVKESGCGLTRLFDGLAKSENARYVKLDDFSYYEEGGCSANYRGETLLLGTASFMRKMDVRLPGSLNLRTGIFLAVDGQLTAVFAVKYQAAESVDWAMRMLKRNRITPVLASRDPNIAPSLLRRKFARTAKFQYPILATRLALSEQEENRGRPRAILLRDGLLPYAETVVGSQRLCRSARQSGIFALLGSIAGVLLTGYLVNLGSFALMTPLAVLVFLLLWLAPVLLLAGWAGRF